VVYGCDGLDEVTTTDKTFVTEVTGGLLKDYEIVPEDFGFKRASLNDLLGGSIDENVKIAYDILAGKPGSRRDIVLFNAGCAIYAADKADTIVKGIRLAEESIDSKAALEKLKQLKEYSQ
jgi:anthranilate phosphoribosyltransferase